MAETQSNGNSVQSLSAKTTVVVHPLVLLSVVDHYNRTCKGTKSRALGVLLGSWKGNVLDVANSFAGDAN
jgi:26S proteasome regulatory subunit N8